MYNKQKCLFGSLKAKCKEMKGGSKKSKKSEKLIKHIHLVSLKLLQSYYKIWKAVFEN